MSIEGVINRLYAAEKTIGELRMKLAKAEHDRDRYKRRIDTLDDENNDLKVQIEFLEDIARKAIKLPRMIETEDYFAVLWEDEDGLQYGIYYKNIQYGWGGKLVDGVDIARMKYLEAVCGGVSHEKREH